ncbi:MAG: lipid-A-disaccharide synthase [Gammaproteobacteria bacterium]|nr:MAG: lipid-A-disaccharide synthase [Gammaproteobacteria bacterium]RLA15241.1 MAG: lipid-A-disaccharide synthase [Gammaproteobacteria bacterium]
MNRGLRAPVVTLSSDSVLRVGVVVGEASGDVLGAALIRELQADGREIVVTGIGGPLMDAAGCQSLFPAERLAVMGFVEPLGRLPELFRIRARLVDHFLKNPPDFFIGIDAPDFTLRLERKLKRAGIPTFHYVSPSVWAWRRGRLKLISEAVNGMLTLFPFESEFYQQAEIPSRFVGHPSYHRIQWNPPKADAREALGLPAVDKVIALLPGSRASEYQRLTTLFIDAAKLISQQQSTHFVVPLINAKARRYVEQVLRDRGQGLSVTLLDGDSYRAMQAADLVLMASGTASLEAMMMGRPLVVAYRLGAITYYLVKLLSYAKWIALPNLLADRQLVPELIQSEASTNNVVAAVNGWFEDEVGTEQKIAEFYRLREQLRGECSPASAILQWLGR